MTKERCLAFLALTFGGNGDAYVLIVGTTEEEVECTTDVFRVRLWICERSAKCNMLKRHCAYVSISAVVRWVALLIQSVQF